MHKPKHTTLPNGLTVLTQNLSNDLGTVYFELIIRRGARHDDNRYFGLAHFCEHVAAESIEASLRQSWVPNYVLSSFEASTMPDYTSYKISVASDDVALALTALGRALRPQNVDDLMISRQRAIIEEEILEELDDQDAEIKNAFAKRYYGENTLSRWPSAGDREVIASFTPTLVNQYLHQFYQPTNAILIITGSFNLEEIQRDIDQHLKFLKATSGHFGDAATSFRGSPAGIKIARNKSEQSGFHWARALPTHNPMQAATANMLVGMLDSYLEHNARNQGFVYRLNASFESFVGHDDFYIESQYQSAKAVAFSKWLKHELVNFEDELTEQNLAAYRNYQLKNLKLDEAYPRAHLETMAWYYLYYQQLVTIEDELALFESVSLDDLMSLYRKVYSQPGTVRISGQFTKSVSSALSGIWA